MNLLLFDRAGTDFFVTGERKRRNIRSDGVDQNILARLQRRVKSAYEAIRHKFDYQENLCSMLRHADSIRLVHSEAISGEDAENRFRWFLDSRERKHKKWMIIDGILALFGSLLTPIPGPNVFFLYPAVRTLSHYLALRGVRRARRLKMLTFEAESVIDRIQSNFDCLDNVDREIRELENRFSLSDLKSLLSTR